MSKLLRIGTRDSALALWQAKTLQESLLDIGILSELVPIKSEGDLNLTQPLYSMGVTGIFTKTLDTALLNNQIDLAIHSMKDVPTQLPKGIVQAAVLSRGHVHDVIVWKNKDAKEKVKRAIATGSLRRKAQWLSKFPEDQIVPLRGNIQTRLSKLKSENWEGAIFAAAALSRLEITDEIVEPLLDFLPAPAQGALLVVCRIEDVETAQQITLLNNSESEKCTQIERDFLHRLEGGCTAPIGALAQCKGNKIHFSGGLYSLQGSPPQEIHAHFPINESRNKGIEIAEQLLKQGGANLMKEFRENHG
jgi:hydroxymethylbilane synthase